MARQNLISEVLSAHADQPVNRQKQNRGGDYASLFPNNHDLPPLLTLADHIKVALQPVTPPTSFKEQLQKDLMAAARRKQLERPGPTVAQLPLIIPAIVGALIALSGLLLLRRRQVATSTQGTQ
ncbi:MAG: hypothetical protein ACE5G8_02515 [Anaerolineae bacterium]